MSDNKKTCLNGHSKTCIQQFRTLLMIGFRKPPLCSGCHAKVKDHHDGGGR